MKHRYRRPVLPEVDISQQGNILSLHLGSETVQSAMNLDNPADLVLSYSRAMMAWLLFAERLPQHITQIGLGGGSFARWIDAFLPDVRQSAVEINPQVVIAARMMFALPPEEDGRFEIIEDDGAKYVAALDGATDLILTDGFDGEQIADALTGAGYFADCRRALTAEGIFAANWWGGDKRYPQFLAVLKQVFDGRVLEIPAETHGNIAVFAFQAAPLADLAKLKKRAAVLSERYRLDFSRMLADAKARNPHNGRSFVFAAPKAA